MFFKWFVKAATWNSLAILGWIEIVQPLIDAITNITYVP